MGRRALALRRRHRPVTLLLGAGSRRALSPAPRWHSRWALALVVVTFALLLVISRAYGGASAAESSRRSGEVPVGCGFSGFFTEVALGFVPALLDGDRFADDGLRVVLLCGQCSEGFLRTALEPRAAAAIRRAWADEATRAASLTARSVVIEHGDPCGMRRWSTKTRPRWVISRTMSEGDPTAEAVRCLRGADEVWVPTAWHVEAYAAAGVERRRLLAVPEPVDVDFFAPDSDAKRGAPFVFFSNFKWEARKGWDLLLEAYWSAFGVGRRPPAAEDVPAVVGGGAARPQPPRRGVRAAARQAARRSRGSRAPRRREHLARRLGRDVPRRRRLCAADARRGGAADRRGDGERPPRHRDQLLRADRLPHRRQLVPLRVARRLPGGQAEPSVADVAQAMKTRAR